MPRFGDHEDLCSHRPTETVWRSIAAESTSRRLWSPSQDRVKISTAGASGCLEQMASAAVEERNNATVRSTTAGIWSRRRPLE
jgi:hypothetical protein